MSSVELNNSSALSKQDLSTLDVTRLTALSPEVISRQATINIGTIGHVAHGKSTVVKAVSGVQTVRFKNELERNITIKLESNGQQKKSSPRPAAELKRKAVKRKRSSNGDEAAKKKRSQREKLDQEQEYEVEQVIDYVVEKTGHSYLVKWKNWSHDSNTWEPTEHLYGCDEVLFMFLESLTKEKDDIEHDYLTLKNELYKCEHSDLTNILPEFVSPKGISIPPPDYEKINKRVKIISKWTETERDPLVIQMLKTTVLEARLYEERQKQLDQLKEWEDEMNSIISKGVPISPLSVVNNVDLVKAPENFIYINDYLPGEKVNIPDDPPLGCSCEPECNSLKRKCCPHGAGNVFAFDKDGRLKVPPGTPIFECNKRCKCGLDCFNRVVQKGRQVKLCIFRTTNGCGWGVKTLEPISKGTFVTEYVGEVITFEEAERRGKVYDKEGQTYLFDLDFNDTNAFPFTVDAAIYGNISHFVNHSCEPNMTVYAVWANCLDPNLPKLALFANKEIKQGEEIFFDYLNQSKTKKGPHTEITENGVDNKAYYNMVCKCGSKKCRKFYL